LLSYGGGTFLFSTLGSILGRALLLHCFP